MSLSAHRLESGRRRDEMVIEASFGLGEAIVSGRVEPDRYVINSLEWKITERRLGAKERAILSRTAGGAEPVQRGASQEQALPDPQIVELAQIAQRVAEHFGSPQDIEWAWANGQLYLLQARPIISLYPLPDHPGLAEGLRIYVNFNAIQGVSEPLTPLGIDTLRLLFGGVLRILHLHRSGFWTSLIVLVGLTALVLYLSLAYGSAFLWLFVGVSAVVGIVLPTYSAFAAIVGLTLVTLAIGVGLRACFLNVILRPKAKNPPERIRQAAALGILRSLRSLRMTWRIVFCHKT